MTRSDDSGGASTPGNRYCERIGLAAVPCVEAMLSRNLNLFHLMVVALLERGGPMPVEEIAERLTDGGAIAESGDMVLSLLATIDDRAVIEKILRHLDLPVDPPVPAPAREPAWLAGSLPGFDAATAPADVWPH